MNKFNTGNRLPTACVMLLMTQAAMAQQAIIDLCRETSSDADRIACLEAALLAKESKEIASEEGKTVEVVEPEQAAPVVVEAKEPPALPPAEPEVMPDTPTAAGIGSEQVIARNLTREEMLANLEEARGLRVAEYGEVPHGRLVVTLENGQVWRQIKGDTQQIRVDLKRNQTVDITESSMGGYKLRLNEIRRTIRVQRIR